MLTSVLNQNLVFVVYLASIENSFSFNQNRQKLSNDAFNLPDIAIAKYEKVKR